jgi:acetyl esterase/lipase
MFGEIVFPLALLLALSVFGDPYFQEPQFVPAPTFADVHYGPHERQVLDFWQAAGKEPAPLLVWIHGGGFNHGSKSVKKALLETCLVNGISVAAINYRYSSQAKGLGPFLDGARSIQFLRTKAADWRIAPSKIICAGNSAGGGITLWLAFHDDLADPASPDPVLRQS